jgi:hypothetical protein
LDTYYWEQYFKKNELKAVLEQEGFAIKGVYPLDHTASVLSFSNLFRDKNQYDEVNRVGLALGRWCEAHLPWITAAQMLFVCVKESGQ